jgi:hypothetical protein
VVLFIPRTIAVWLPGAGVRASADSRSLDAISVPLPSCTSKVGFSKTRDVISQPSPLNRIRGPTDFGAGSGSSGIESDSAGALADCEEPVLQLGLLRWAQAKPYSDRREAAGIITKPRLHRLFVGRRAGIHKRKGGSSAAT